MAEPILDKPYNNRLSYLSDRYPKSGCPKIGGARVTVRMKPKLEL